MREIEALRALGIEADAPAEAAAPAEQAAPDASWRQAAPGARPPPLPNRVSGFRERFEAISRESSGRNSEGEASRRSSSRLVPPGAPPLPGRRNSGAGLSPRKSATFTLSDTTGQTVLEQ